MSFHKLLIANRGEIAIRIARAAGDAGLATVAIYSADDAQSLHVRAADAAHEIPGRGARAYLDIEAVISAAKATGCDAVHPGYGFLSENATLARRCIEESIVFVGPSPDALDLFGDKAQAKALARTMRRAHHRRHQRADQPGRGKGLPGIAGRRRRHHDQGDRRRRRPRHAHRRRRRASWRRPMRAASPRPRPPSAATASMSSA